MAIYPDKKDGKLTGRWRVEVVKNNRRARGRFATLEEATKADKEWRTEFPDMGSLRKDTRGVPKTLKDLWSRNDHKLWYGKVDRDNSRARLEKVLTMLGARTAIDSVTTEKLDVVVAKLLDQDLEGSTINKYLSTLHKLLVWGKDRKWVREIPKFPWQDDNEGRLRWLTDEEELTLSRMMEARVSVLVVVAIATGMRRGELLALEKKNVEHNQVHIWKSKNKKSRSVPISRETYEQIMWLLDVGLPTIHQIRYEWDKVRKYMKLEGDPWFTFHVCRHTCATRLVKANVNLRVVQKWLGHKSIKTTERYAQVADDTLSDALSRLEVFRAGHLAPTPMVGYSSPAPVLGLSNYNLKGLTITMNSGQNEGNVRGRGEIGRHAGFRFLWGNPCSQQDTDETEEPEGGP